VQLFSICTAVNLSMTLQGLKIYQKNVNLALERVGERLEVAIVTTVVQVGVVLQD
jgi:hypothetical protein